MPISEPKGLWKGWARKIEPFSASSKSGVSTRKSPILDSLGQAGPGAEPAVSASYWAGVQTPRPAPTDGLIVIPSGRETTALRTWEGARPAGLSSPSWSTSRSNSKPVAEEARRVAGWAKDWVDRLSRSQPERGSGWPDSPRTVELALTVAGCCQLSALAVAVSGPAQVSGRVRKD